MILTILLVIIGVSGMIFAIYWIPKWQTRKRENIKPEQIWEAENEFRKTLIQVFGGLVIIIGLMNTFIELNESQMNTKISREESLAGQIANRFSKAIEFLAMSNTTSRKGGIYALGQIARELPENYLGIVIDLLTDFVRNAEIIKEELIKEKYKIKPETQIAMTVLGRIRTEKNKKHWENLSRINLRDARLRGARLRGAFLRDADLENADLESANLTGANLTGANLRGAYLRDTNLMGADLTGAFLMDADLTGADLTGAYLTGAYLRDAKGLKVEQLLKVTTLYQLKNLPPEMEKELKKKKPELFEDPFK